jgi:hypothetical protein
VRISMTIRTVKRTIWPTVSRRMIAPPGPDLTNGRERQPFLSFELSFAATDG